MNSSRLISHHLFVSAVEAERRGSSRPMFARRHDTKAEPRAVEAALEFAGSVRDASVGAARHWKLSTAQRTV